MDCPELDHAGLLRCPERLHELSPTWIATPPGGRGRWGWLTCECATYPVVDDVAVMLRGTVEVHSDFMSGGLVEGQPIAELLQILRGDDPVDALVRLLALPLGPWPLSAVAPLRRQLRRGGLASAALRAGRLRIHRLLDRRADTTCRDWLIALHLQSVTDGDTFNYFLYRFSQPRHLAALSLIDGLPDGPVLDLCCGVGHVSHALDAAGHPVIGLDHNFASVWLARWFMVPRGLMICGDASGPLPLADGAVASVNCTDAFHYLPNRAHVLAEMRRVARGGPLLISRISRAGSEVSEGYAETVADWRRELAVDGDVTLHAEHDLVDGYLAGWAAGGSVDSPRVDQDPWLSATIPAVSEPWPPAEPLASPRPHARGPLGINPMYRPEPGGHGLVFEHPSAWYAMENGEMQAWMPDRVLLTDAQALAVARGDGAAPELAELVDQYVVIGLPSRYTDTLQRPLRSRVRRHLTTARARVTR